MLILCGKGSYFDNGGQCAEIQLNRYNYNLRARADEL